jgi:hypothetical protein
MRSATVILQGRYRAARLIRSPRAQGTIEMITMVVLVALVVVVSVRVLGTRLQSSYDCARESVANGKALPEAWRARTEARGLPEPG